MKISLRMALQNYTFARRTLQKITDAQHETLQDCGRTFPCGEQCVRYVRETVISGEIVKASG